MTAQAAPEPPVAETTEPEIVAPVKSARFARMQQAIARFFATRKPRLIPSIVVFLCTLILLSLGTWQLLRLQEKNTLIATLKTQWAAAPADLRAHMPQQEKDWHALENKTVLIEGKWLGLYQFKLSPRTYEEQTGFQLIQPLQLTNGQIVLVNRGFVRDGAAILDKADSDAILQGIILPPETKKPMWREENIPARDQWTWPDVAAMAHEVGTGNVAPVLLYAARDTVSDDYPIGGQAPAPANNNHAQYAMTWYALALALLLVYLAACGDKDVATAATPEGEAMDPVKARGLYPEATD